MKAAVLEDKEILTVREMNIHFPEGWVKIRVRSAGICGSDLNFWSGKSIDTVRGKILGHEISGTILEIPKNYKGRFKVGDDVVVEPLISCGKCEYCKSGKYYLCRELKHIGIFFPGGFAEVTAAPPEKLFSLPSNLSHDLGALADVVAVGVHCVNTIRTLKSKRDISMCIIGDGPIGLSLIPVLKKLENVHSITLIGKHQKNIDLAKSFGVKVVTCEELDSYDIVIEAVGGRRGVDAFDLSFKIIKPGGMLVVLGQYHNQFYDFDIHRLVNEELKLIGSFSYGIFNGKKEIEEALNIISEFKNYFENMITHHVKLDNISKGFKIAVNKAKYGSIKVMINS